MTIRVQARRVRGLGRAAEWFLLLVGIVALDIFIWSKVDAGLYQAYQNWLFDRALQHEQTISKSKEPTRPQLFAVGAVIGRLEIPRLGMSMMVREGVEEGTLRRAVGHIPGTPFPGQSGNVGVAAHRDTFFRPLRHIHAQDEITLTTLNGKYIYEVESIKIVSQQDVTALKAASWPELTLVTCYPFYYVGSAPRRFIVHARQVSSSPIDKAEAAPAG